MSHPSTGKRCCNHEKTSGQERLGKDKFHPCVLGFQLGCWYFKSRRHGSVNTSNLELGTSTGVRTNPSRASDVPLAIRGLDGVTSQHLTVKVGLGRFGCLFWNIVQHWNVGPGPRHRLWRSRHDWGPANKYGHCCMYMSPDNISITHQAQRLNVA